MRLTNEQAHFLRQQRICVGLPLYGGTLQGQTFQSLLPFFTGAAQLGMTATIRTVTNLSNIDAARNLITADFLSDTAATHLLWVDADMSFDPDDIYRLILHDKDVIGGMYPTKSFPPRYCAQVLREAAGSNGWNTRDGLVPVARLGMGFTLIKRSVIEKMIAAHPERKFTDSNRTLHALWATGLDEARNWVGEDYRFCDLWRRIGGEVWADPNMVVNHIGQFNFSADRQRLLASLGATPDGKLNLAPQIPIYSEQR